MLIHDLAIIIITLFSAFIMERVYISRYVRQNKEYYAQIDFQKAELLRLRNQLEQERPWTAKENYQDILESIQEVIFQTDECGRWTFLNPAWCMVTGHSHEESIGHDWLAHVHPDDREAISDSMQESIAAGRESFRRTCRYVTKEDKVRWMECFIQLRREQDGTFAGAYGTLSDITDRVLAEQKASRVLKDLQDLKYALDESAILAITDAKGVITYVNDKFSEISQYTREELIGQTHGIVNSGYHGPSFFRDMWTTIRQGQVWRGEVKNSRKDGSTYWVDTTIVPVLDQEGKPQQYVSIRSDITGRKQAEQQLIELNHSLKELSARDGLTGIYNRRYFDEVLEQEWSRSGRNARPLSLILFDIDHFKLYNDHYGHQQGDACLQQAAQAMQQSVQRAVDMGARYGGEEFVLILPDTNLQGAMLVAERVREKLESLQIPHARSPVSSVVTGSFGVASLVPEDAATAQELLAQADRALYLAKRSGRNRVACYEELADMLPGPDIEPSPYSFVQQYIDVLHAQDMNTWEHSNRVSQYALLLAAGLGLNEQQREKVFMAALLHDIGKLDIPESILKKPGRLNKAEFQVIQQHPQLGWEKLARHEILRMDREILDGVMYHHERWDGAGYPAGLQGKEIPFIARLLGVADSFAAMTEHRVYKRGMTEEQALEELHRNKGKQFDPAMVDAFAGMLAADETDPAAVSPKAGEE
ncbi:diguanylate cyclase [Ectobacillus ponti]|uniref:Diguanylate cyclase n=1 Tax=Ectobacillus ponti TaxID=2961894 RepID=A0AA41X261_9BACI|nr:diguanylate cyclase [Ectobacillus ponti]MCP8967232.1 diguanylate cyclase [Ectobacillus ponti]